MRLDTAIPVARGATGEVLRARDPERDEEVAIKVLADDDPALVARMEREARAQQRLAHPNICPVYGIDTLDGRRCIIMRFIDGDPLDEVLASLGCEDKIRLLRTVADAVAAAHKAGVIHRDLKPANIIVERTPTGLHPWVVDFGLARSVTDTTLTQYGQALGTPGYMAPEQARGRSDLDSRCDVYALGVLLFEAFAGRLPHQGESVAELLLKTVGEDAPDIRSIAPGTPAPLARIVNQCLERSASLRYRDAAGVRDDLDAYLGGRPVQARRTGRLHRMRRLAARNPTLSATVALLLVAALTAAGLAGFSMLSRTSYAEAQAELARYYAGVARELENRLRLIHSRPIHDIRPEIARIEEQVTQLSRGAPKPGTAAESAIRYALGRAWFALGDYEKARRDLQAAWQRGMRTEEVALYLGRTHLALYSDALRQVRLEPDPALREAREARLRRAFLEPGLDFLDRSGPESFASEQASFAQSLLLHHRGRSDDALALLADLAGRLDWPAPAWVLSARLRLERAMALDLVEDAAAVEQELEAAARDLDRAMTLLRSDPEVYRTRCQVAAVRLNVRVQGAPPVAIAEPELAACSDLLVIHPEDPDNLVAAAAAWERLAALQRQRNEDPTETARRAFELAEKAIAADPNLGEAWYRRGAARLTAARWAIVNGEDAGALLGQAIEDLERAVALEPGLAGWQIGLSTAYTISGRWRYTRGESGDADYQRAVEVLDRASRLPGVGARTRIRLPYTLTWQAYYRYTTGVRADELLDQAVESARRTVADFPDLATAHVALGYAAWTYGDYLLLQGRDPEPYASEGLAAYERVLELDPGRYASRYNRFSTLLVVIEGIQNRNEPSAAELEQAGRLLAELERLSPDDPGLEIHHAALAHLKARAAVLADDDPRPHFAAARAALAGSPAAIDRIEVLIRRSRLAALQTRWRLEHGRFDVADFEADLAEIGAGLELLPDVHQARAERARLAVFGARSDKIGEEQRAALREQAREDLETALAGNAILAPRYAEVAAELGLNVEALAQSTPERLEPVGEQ